MTEKSFNGLPEIKLLELSKCRKLYGDQFLSIFMRTNSLNTLEKLPIRVSIVYLAYNCQNSFGEH